MFDLLIRHSPLFYYIQSLWRDEAFSILAAEKPLSFILPKLSFEPPFYYTLLHFWIKIFGNSEISARTLSFIAFVMATVIIIEWSERLFHRRFLRWLTPLLFFLNPMLIYYAFEVRTYGWFIFFSALSMFAYDRKKWWTLTAATALGFYTHTYFIFVPFIQILHFLITESRIILKKPNQILNQPFARAMIPALVLIAPWFIRIFSELPRLKESWYFPVDFQLVKSVLGNMYMGYEGTPWYLWRYTAYGSIIIFLLSLSALKFYRLKSTAGYLFLQIYLPLSIVIGTSFFKPMFVNRYLIFATVAMILLINLSLDKIKPKFVAVSIAFMITLLTVSINIWYPRQHPKVPIRDSIKTINRLMKPDDLIYVDSPLILFETIYYANDRSKVFLYNPKGSAFPWYVGDAVFSRDMFATHLPVKPNRAFLLSEDGNFYISYRTGITNN